MRNGLPDDFRFGAATAAYQIEGATHSDGRGESIWDRFAHTPGKVLLGDTGDVACDHYRLWRQDLDLMQALGIESYRFSIAWPRLLPAGDGEVNERGVRFYRRVVEGLLERGIEPIATLYHWDLPQALQDRGGWAARETVDAFAEYARVAYEQLGDLVSQWITINEPWVVAFQGHAHGTKAPGIRDWPTAIRVSHNLLLAHGMAVGVLRGMHPDAKVGISLNLAPIYAASDSKEDRCAARRMDGHLNRWFLDPVFRGAYPADMVELYEKHVGPVDFIREWDLEAISAPTDFLGVNYYSPQRLRAVANNLPLGVAPAPLDGPKTAMGWEVHPPSLHELLRRLRDEYGNPPIYITENGASFADPPALQGMVDDPERTAFIEQHIEQVRRAIDDGVDVRRYCVWSLLDNFEWEHGYGQRFGIVYVDYENQRRVPKRSGLWYRDYIEQARAGDVDPLPAA